MSSDQPRFSNVAPDEKGKSSSPSSVQFALSDRRMDPMDSWKKAAKEEEKKSTPKRKGRSKFVWRQDERTGVS